MQADQLVAVDAAVVLEAMRGAFGQGRIGWSVLKAITRVASVASQASWIDFVRENDVEHTLAEARDVGMGKVAQPLRAALTGSGASPGIFEVMTVLGRAESLARIGDQAAG